jgi:hypothetical protein
VDAVLADGDGRDGGRLVHVRRAGPRTRVLWTQARHDTIHDAVDLSLVEHRGSGQAPLT